MPYSALPKSRRGTNDGATTNPVRLSCSSSATDKAYDGSAFRFHCACGSFSNDQVAGSFDSRR